jgi:hypothetical protein
MPPTTALLLLFEPREPGELALRMIDVQGQFCGVAAVGAPPVTEAVVPIMPHVKNSRGEWDAGQWVQRFSVPAGTRAVESVTFRIVSEHYAQSVLVACYAGTECKFRRGLLLPAVKPEGRKGTRLTFPLDFDVRGLTGVSIFYLDRVSIVDPHLVGFKFRTVG